MSLVVLYEDNHLIGVCKPAGMVTQHTHDGDGCLMDAVKAYLREKYHKPGEVFLGLLHRLDRVGDRGGDAGQDLQGRQPAVRAAARAGAGEDLLGAGAGHAAAGAGAADPLPRAGRARGQRHRRARGRGASRRRCPTGCCGTLPRGRRPSAWWRWTWRPGASTRSGCSWRRSGTPSWVTGCTAPGSRSPGGHRPGGQAGALRPPGAPAAADDGGAAAPSCARSPRRARGCRPDMRGRLHAAGRRPKASRRPPGGPAADRAGAQPRSAAPHAAGRRHPAGRSGAGSAVALPHAAAHPERRPRSHPHRRVRADGHQALRRLDDRRRSVPAAGHAGGHRHRRRPARDPAGHPLPEAEVHPGRATAASGGVPERGEDRLGLANVRCSTTRCPAAASASRWTA